MGSRENRLAWSVILTLGLVMGVTWLVWPGEARTVRESQDEGGAMHNDGAEEGAAAHRVESEELPSGSSSEVGGSTKGSEAANRVAVRSRGPRSSPCRCWIRAIATGR